MILCMQVSISNSLIDTIGQIDEDVFYIVVFIDAQQLYTSIAMIDIVFVNVVNDLHKD